MELTHLTLLPCLGWPRLSYYGHHIRIPNPSIGTLTNRSLGRNSSSLREYTAHISAIHDYCIHRRYPRTNILHTTRHSRLHKSTQMQAAFKSPNPALIKEVPGLYISDIIPPSSPPQLHDQGITHVLSILAAPTRAPTIPKDLSILHRAIELEDDPFADLLAVLKHACEFIDEALCTEINPDLDVQAKDQYEKEVKDPKVLVHCLQGLSRSPSIVIAYTMRRLNIPYEAALEIVQRARPIVLPNGGFEEQLRLWGEMEYSVVDEEGEKGVYTEWKSRRAEMVGMGEEVVNRERVRGLVGLVAKIGARRASGY
ncbi:protein-tyrosine phosphatase-like protein [Paraphoma chrysanthemicola]|uniref:Protein-tyrosine phosphatase-like protein n=1 Tax=Paraphoma chrysanthemicola TaxID=798071 RepID=A0A8K0RA13_9PLEO|nr:protein-tyrosine phosphatase-like protein [Paraphoma chrysanthemicola]